MKDWQFAIRQCSDQQLAKLDAKPSFRILVVLLASWASEGILLDTKASAHGWKDLHDSSSWNGHLPTILYGGAFEVGGQYL
eukprot:2008535-Amphidinium_carterae.1